MVVGKAFSLGCNPEVTAQASTVTECQGQGQAWVASHSGHRRLVDAPLSSPGPNLPPPGPRSLRPPGKGKFDIFKSRALEGSMRPGGPARGRYS